MAHEVFVSYSNKDKPVADAVVAGLESKEIRCWIAPRDIVPGSSWGQAIVQAIETSKIMVMILSENSNKSRQVVREVERAVSKEVIIIPFRIENIDPTGAMAYYLSTEHWLDALTQPMEKHIEKLGNTIQLFLTGKELTGIEEIARRPEFQPFTKSKFLSGRKFLIPVLSIIVISAIVVMLTLTLTGKNLFISATSTLEIMATETSKPETPTPLPPPTFSLLGRYRTSRAANGLFIENNMLFLANGGDGLIRINVSDPSDPKPVDTYIASDARDVVVSDDVAYIVNGDYSRHLIIMPFGGAGGSITFPPEGEGLMGAQSLYYVKVKDDLAHLTGHNYWAILDVNEPLQPEVLWTWQPEINSGNPCMSVIDDNFAFIGAGWEGLYVFDITNSQAPQLVGQFDTPNWITGMELVDNYLYLSLGESGLMALDVSDPSRPLLMDKVELTGFLSDISVSGNVLFVIYRVSEDYVVLESGVFAVDVTDKEKLIEIAVYDELDLPTDIQVVEDIIFVTDETRGLVVLTISMFEQ